ncbi:MAG: primosomal protein N' [Pseudanabaenaceae cyanobacterium SKYGB_i_bin29]|nr:primosomal protein N' [Pseudanabaenaceae cyanobacterium SKYG29]MDW8420376.1 primosomal protein N' [Pseudanabaenaceae cyanobacterium SKYGB_i_bin29]
MATKIAQVLVNYPGIEDLLSYSIPDDLAIDIGDIVTVPLGRRFVNGLVMELTAAENLTLANLKPIVDCVSTSILPDSYWEMLRFTSEYYCTPLLQTLRVALPPKLLQTPSDRVLLTANVAQDNLSENALQVFYFLKSYPQGVSKRYLQQKLSNHAVKGLDELKRKRLVKVLPTLPEKIRPCTELIVTLLKLPDVTLTTRQAEVMHVLQRLGGEVKKTELIKVAQTSDNMINRLAKLGYISIEERDVLRFAYSINQDRDQPKQLNEAQQLALNKICSYLEQAQTILLEGVTGSGKTEVYLQAIAKVLAMGKSALVLVPEIGLTPQLTDRFCQRFGNEQVLIYHSQLSDGERFDTWRYLLVGEPRVVIGTRSAIFLPLINLGMIILDEEHDPSFKQDQPQPCYHARTIAQWRSQKENCPLILGSATPCAETLHRSDLVVLQLPYRIDHRPLPPIKIVDMRQEFSAGNRSVFSRLLQTEIQTMQGNGKQGILFVPRRGHSTFVSCRNCGYVVMCPHCDVSLSYHLNSEFPRGQLICHYCNYRQNQTEECPQCGSQAFRYFGTGTQKIMEELTKLFPTLRVIRFDSDTTRNKDQHRYLLTKFQQGEADLLVGTQMVTKGLDIPQVTLVGVLASDSLLYLSDFRAGERAMQLLLQVAGRAGRGEDPGNVIIQTYNPDSPVIQAVVSYDYRSYMTEEIQQRLSFNYPPQCQIAVIHLSSTEPDRVERIAAKLAEYLYKPNSWELLGPSPAQIPRVANRYRWQIMLKRPFSSPTSFPTWSELRHQVKDKNIRITVDVDPLHIL